MKFFKLTLIILSSFYLCVSCKKECVNEIDNKPIFDINILNKQDTINISDSIVFFVGNNANKYNSESGMYYDINDFKTVIQTKVVMIDDSLNFTSFPFSVLETYFDYKIEIGEFSAVDEGVLPLKVNDSLFYKFTVYPKEVGLFAFFSGISFVTDEYYSQNRYDGYVLARKDKCILLGSGAFFAPSMIQGEIDNNNFDVYYNSGLFHPGSEDINNLDRLRDINKLYYYVYVQ